MVGDALMKTTQPAVPMFDWEIEFVTSAGKTEKTTIGYAPTGEDAAARLLEIYGKPANYRDWHAVSAKALRQVGAHCPNDVQIACLSVSFDQHGRYSVDDDQGRNAYYEHGGGHIKTALEFLLRVRPDAKWKTVGLLKALRQAFREDSVNCRTDEMDWLLERGPTRGAVNGYLFGARCRDHAHHGQNTF